MGTYWEFLAATFDRKLCLQNELVQAAFNSFDRNKDGDLQLDELVKGDMMGKLTMEEVKGVLKELDRNGDGLIDFLEFKDMLAVESAVDVSSSWKTEQSSGKGEQSSSWQRFAL